MSDIKSQFSDSATTAVMKSSPPWILVAADKVMGLSLNEWVMIAALVYTLLQIFVLIRDKIVRRNNSCDPGNLT